MIVSLAAVLAGCGHASPKLRWSDDEAVWSPSGHAIFFVSNRGATPTQNDDANGTYALYSLRLDGHRPLRITDDGCDDHDPQPSPNGQEIAFDSSCTSASPTPLKLIQSSGGPETVLAPNVDEFAWSPDGRSIAFTRPHDPNDPFSNDALWDVRPGAPPRRLVSSSFAVGTFDWSRDGKRIAFGCGGSMCITEVRTRAVRVLHRFSAQNVRWVAWSPDDKELAFIDGSGGSYEPNYSAWVMTADGAGAHRLPRFGEGNVDGVQWLPAHPGKLLVNTDYADVYVVDADGKRKRDLPFEADIVAPSRDGTQLLFVRRIFDSDGYYYRSAVSLANLKTGKTESLTQHR